MTTTNTTAPVEFVAFIVPNGLQKYDNVYFKDSLDTALNTLGLKIDNPEALLAQVRIEEENGRRENFTDHGWGKKYAELFGAPFDPEHPTYQEGCAPWLLPIGILQDVKECDVREFVTPTGVTIRLKFKQLLAGRYDWFGPFEHLLDVLTKNYYRDHAVA